MLIWRATGNLLLFFSYCFVCDAKSETLPGKEREMVVQRDATPLGSRTQVVLSYADVIERVRDSVVTVYVSRASKGEDREDSEENPFDLVPRRRSIDDDSEEKYQGSGSGVILTQDGLIVTNAHVVKDADKIYIRLRGREEDMEAVMMGIDPATDIAVLKMEAESLKPSTLGDSSVVRPGDVVLAIGSPFGLEQTITLGIISATGRGTLGLIDGGMEDFLQTDAAINPGNSGGPLLDGLGRVIGINTARYWGDNIGFAVPANLVLKVAGDLYRHGWVVRGFLGVHTLEVTPKLVGELKLPKKARGVIINSVEADEAAAKAGFHSGDLVIEVNGRRVENGARFRLSLASQQPGDEATFQVLRDGKEISLQAKLGDPPELRAARAIAAKAEPSDHEWAPGLFVAEVDRDWRMKLKLSPQIKGLVVTKDFKIQDRGVHLSAGDQILLINGKPVKNQAEAKAQLASLKTQILLLKIRGAEDERFVAVPRVP
ncbi:serine protease Do [Prosthecobacter fusiformis]|uniref:Serine protease Do n=1 Tax=Prosthecobacter fusiformis TaxID=48464 RepID=A0A4R7RMZ2_9BACT|nr:trypsin-like peptidase domain-containing protein [Prosthecobacter fusiformis]TDU66158.1 serine protease Do [Prosthecobacter fusiformis]